MTSAVIPKAPSLIAWTSAILFLVHHLARLRGWGWPSVDHQDPWGLEPSEAAALAAYAWSLVRLGWLTLLLGSVALALGYWRRRHAPPEPDVLARAWSTVPISAATIATASAFEAGPTAFDGTRLGALGPWAVLALLAFVGWMGLFVALASTFCPAAMAAAARVRSEDRPRASD